MEDEEASVAALQARNTVRSQISAIILRLINEMILKLGAPQQSYGPPAQSQARVVGIVIEDTVPAIQVAQYRAEESAGGYASSQGGYPSGPARAPSSSYGAPQRAAPSSSYGAPF